MVSAKSSMDEADINSQYITALCSSTQELDEDAERPTKEALGSHDLHSAPLSKNEQHARVILQFRSTLANLIK